MRVSLGISGLDLEAWAIGVPEKSKRIPMLLPSFDEEFRRLRVLNFRL